MDADRCRRAHANHDARGRLRAQPTRSLRHQLDGFPQKLAQPGQRDERDDQAVYAARHVHPKYHGSRYYGKAMNITRLLTAAYDHALGQYDLLLMPTTPIKAHELPLPNAPRELVVERALNMISNTAPFDITHHPAMAIPCGMSEGLPVSMMLVGKHWDEPTIYRAAYAFERAGEWAKM